MPTKYENTFVCAKKSLNKKKLKTKMLSNTYEYEQAMISKRCYHLYDTK